MAAITARSVAQCVLDDPQRQVVLERLSLSVREHRFVFDARHVDAKGDRREESTIFLTEGDSAGGAMVQARDVQTQAIYSLKGKPLNTHGLGREAIYKNDKLVGSGENADSALPVDIVDGFSGDVLFSENVTLVGTFSFVFRPANLPPCTVAAAQGGDTGPAIKVTDKDGIRTELQDAELELRYRYGWTIPLRSLRYWALGVPDPALAAETRFGEDGQLEYLSQRGWDVAITRYREGGGQSMPNRLSAENGDTTVRLVIDSWYFFK